MTKDRKAVFFDRDGVINVPPTKSRYITSPSEFNLMPGISEAIRMFRDEGYLVIVVTNQQCVGLGLLSHEGLDEIHERMKTLLAEEDAQVDDILYCPHRAEENCDCRKPNPGMLIEASKRHGIDLKQSIMIGDSERDIQAGQTAGCHSVLLKNTTD